MVELPLGNLPRESENRNIPNKYYMLRPRSARSKVKGHLQLYHAYVKETGGAGAADDSNEDEENDVTVEDVDTPTGRYDLLNLVRFNLIWFGKYQVCPCAFHQLVPYRAQNAT